ncbi:helix-turn-helix domain-containing protein (plasmid) [Alicyclobacillus curvatus]|nr:helix-turn-helix domain-containing protein [Alicyclobacillus curvatus]
MGYSDTVHELNAVAVRSHLISQLSMIAIYLLDDPNYSREDAARDLVGIINDLDSVSSYITIENGAGTPNGTIELPVKAPEAAAAVERESYPLILTSKHIGEIMHIERHKVAELAHSKGFPRLKATGHIRVPRDAFFKWLDSTVAKPY